MKAYVNLIVELLRLTYLLLQFYIKEQARAIQFAQTLKDAVQRMVDNRAEAINEQAYLDGLIWEKEVKYKAYKEQCLAVLTAGGGIAEMEKKTKLAFNLWVNKYKNNVIDFLKLPYSIEDKSIVIAKYLTEIQFQTT